MNLDYAFAFLFEQPLSSIITDYLHAPITEYKETADTFPKEFTCQRKKTYFFQS